MKTEADGGRATPPHTAGINDQYASGVGFGPDYEKSGLDYTEVHDEFEALWEDEDVRLTKFKRRKT